ncbi:hypothetical protein BH23ACT8_BH23ACT8_11850 [soil metagenome]
MTAPGTLALALEVARILESLGIDYVIGGSVASSLVGEPRATVDLDVAVAMTADHIPPLLEVLADDYYVSETAARDAVRRRAAFNLIHLETMQKVDLFVLGDALLDRLQIARRQRVVLDDDGRMRLWVGSVEDQILRKLWWFRLGGEVSERQWRDVIAMLRVQGPAVDVGSLRETAREAALEDLLDRALAEASPGGAS